MIAIKRFSLTFHFKVCQFLLLLGQLIKPLRPLFVSHCLCCNLLRYLSVRIEQILGYLQTSQKKEMHVHLDWLVDLIKEHGICVPKTIIFCNTLKEIAIVVDNLLVKLGNVCLLSKFIKREERYDNRDFSFYYMA